ncbi:hypothetical protein [Halomonas salipaludis]|uniref:Uncharacterized protein n=1 Tax=Halomonas salipaludis TaxID=2032625 RepID=A0A2A2F3C4_9GAMM|nr:hypothetical protein [Halomonas salipaludis]PAU79214.1 hypothetical protein CK498_02265 [Halomonas salipaludis]
MLRLVSQWLRRRVAQDDALDERDLPDADLRNPFEGDWLDAHERATGERVRLSAPGHVGKPDRER